MRRNIWMGLILMLFVTNSMFAASCSKKAVKSNTDTAQTEKDSVAVQAATIQVPKAEEIGEERTVSKQTALGEERSIEEQRRQTEIARQIEAARKKEFLEELILFDFDSAILARTTQDRLKRKAKWLNLNPGVAIIIEGHCDERGTNTYNLALGERRAQAAKAFLLDLGISESRVSLVSYGEERPFAKGPFEDAWSLNRRAHFVIE